MFASRTKWDLTPNRLAQRLAERRQAGRPILDLTESNPTRCGFHYPPEILEALSLPENLIYDPSPKGLAAAREAIAAYYADRGVTVDPEHIVLTAGTSEAYSFLFRLVADPGDRVLVPRPSYPLFDYLAAINDIEVCSYPLVYCSGWHVDLASARETMTPRTRAILVVNPNNPTGSFLKRHELAGLVEVCQEFDIALISDEVFADYPFEPGSDSGVSVAGNSQAMTFALGGISKLLGLPQMKLGWICASGPRNQVVETVARLEIMADTYLSVNTPVQNALPRWLGLRDTLARQIHTRIVTNRAYLMDRIQSPLPCQVLEAEGGWYAVIRVPCTQTEEQMVLDLLDQGILVHPGYFFDFETEGHLVISLLPRPDLFQQGVETIISRQAAL